jgi:predicted transcriptional regulator
MESQRTVHPVRTISFRIAEEKVAALDTIAKAMDRDRSYVLNEVVESYLQEQQRFATLVQQGLQASEQGRLVEDEDVLRLMDSWSSKHDEEKTGRGEKASMEKA